MMTAAGMNQRALPQLEKDLLLFLGHQENLKLLSAALDKPLLHISLGEESLLGKYNKTEEMVQTQMGPMILREKQRTACPSKSSPTSSRILPHSQADLAIDHVPVTP